MAVRWLDDLKLAWTGLTRAPAFTGAAVLTLALGIAGVTVMFALVQGVLLRRWPVQDQARLVVGWKQLPAAGFDHYPFGDEEIAVVARSSRLLESAAGVARSGVSRWVAQENGESNYLNGAVVTGGFFQVLGIEAALGRALTSADDAAGAARVIVISDGLWRRRYGSARDVIGRRVTLDEQSFIVAGVMPPGIDYPRGVEVWRPAGSIASDGPFGDAARREIDLIARLRPGVSGDQLTAELTAFTRQFEVGGRRDVPTGLVPIVRSFESTMVGDLRRPLLVLFGAVGFVLIIAGANVANLLLMRAESRRREVAIRKALGANRLRIGRLLLLESGVLALTAGVAGLALASALLRPLMLLVPDGLPRVDSVHIDFAVVLFTVAVAFATSLFAGLVPALSSIRADSIEQLQSGNRGVTSAEGRIGRRAFVVSQIALAVMTLVAAGLLTRSLIKLESVDLGLSADHLVFIELALPQARYADRARHAQLLDDAMRRLEGEADVSAVTPVNVPPFAGIGGWDVPHFTAEGQDAAQVDRNASLNLESIHPNYFKTFGIVLQRGRAFTEADGRNGLPVAIVSDDVARATWPGQDPVGKRLKMGGISSRDAWMTVVGVAAATRYRELTRPRPTLYVPAAQFQMTAEILALRTTGSIERVTTLARQTVQQVDASVSVMRVQPFSDMLNMPLAEHRFSTMLSSLFGLASLMLATIGVYAVIAASVRQRDREIGIRVAFGATASNVRRLVFGEALWLATLGAGIGALGAAWGAQLVDSMLFETTALNPPMIFAAIVILMAAAALAALVPVRRAIRIDAVRLLQTD